MAKPIDDSRWHDPAILTNGRRVSYGADLDEDFVPRPRTTRIGDLAGDADDPASLAKTLAAFGSLAAAASSAEDAEADARFLTPRQILNLPVEDGRVELPADASVQPGDLLEALRQACGDMALPGALARLLIQEAAPPLSELVEVIAAVGAKRATPRSPASRRQRVEDRPAHQDEDDERRSEALATWFKGKTAATVALALLSIAFAGSLLLSGSRGASAEVEASPVFPAASDAAASESASVAPPQESVAPPQESSSESREALVVGTAGTEPKWSAIVGELDSLRTTSFSAGKASALKLVNAPDSEAAEQDNAVMAELTRLGARVEGLQTTVSSVEVIDSSINSSRNRVQLNVTDSRSGYDVVEKASGEIISRQPARSARTWLVTLVKVGDSWLMQSSRPVDG